MRHGRRAMTDRQSTHGHDCWGWGPKHYECAVAEIERLREQLRLATVDQAIEEADANDARAEIEALRAEVDALREALAGLITWIPSADTYRRLGFDPEAPMRALGEARAARENGKKGGRPKNHRES